VRELVNMYSSILCFYGLMYSNTITFTHDDYMSMPSLVMDMYSIYKNERTILSKAK
jgi:hypothetical protein